jgi:hypothetical protein
MKALAKAIVFAVVYIDHRDSQEPTALDDDVKALESIAAVLADCSDEEKNALAKAAEDALTESNWTADYGKWMENMFGDNWKGNKKVT